MTLSEMFKDIEKQEQKTHMFIDTIIVKLEVQYNYEMNRTILTEILWHDPSLHSCITEFMADGFSWCSDWYHCAKPENVNVIAWKDINEVQI